MKPVSEHRRYLAVILLLWAATFLFRIGETSLKTDGLTYSAVAKKMAESGNWKVPTYTRSVYSTFFMHPPLFLWLQAINFRLAGVSDVTARFVPALFALASFGALYAFGVWVASSWLGFLAALVLLFSYPYVKYASDPHLDGALGFFFLGGLYSLARLHEEKPKKRWALSLGLSLWGAFMTKGIAAAGFYAVVAGYGFLLPLLPDTNRLAIAKKIALGFIVTGVLFGLWIGAGGGAHYLHEYWITSVSGRLSAPSLQAHLAPFTILGFDYFVFLPAWFLAVVRVLPRAWSETRPRLIALTALCALSIPVGFAVSGHFNECYLIPFLSCSALPVAFALEGWLYPHADRIRRGLAIAGWAFALVCAIYPHRIRTARPDPIRFAAPAAAAHFARPEFDEVLISAQLAAKWDGLAVVLWATPWDATWVTEIPRPQPRQLLLAAAQDRVSADWKLVSEISGEGYAVYRAP